MKKYEENALDWKFYNDHKYISPRGWHFSASWGPIKNNPRTLLHHGTEGFNGADMQDPHYSKTHNHHQTPVSHQLIFSKNNTNFFRHFFLQKLAKNNPRPTCGTSSSISVSSCEGVRGGSASPPGGVCAAWAMGGFSRWHCKTGGHFISNKIHIFSIPR